MKELDICLVAPSKRSNLQTIPISLIYLASWLKREGFAATIIDIKRTPYKALNESKEQEVMNKIVSEIIIKKPRIVGITCFTSEYNSVIRLAERIKKRIDVKIIVGGVHATLLPKDFIYRGSPVDIVVRGEGEETLSELLSKDLMPDSLKGIKGIGFLEGDNMHLTPSRPFIDDIGRLPLPSYDGIDMRYYLRMTRFVMRYLYTSGVTILTSRGCPFPCTFCAAKNLWKNENSQIVVRYRPIAQVIDEIRYLKDKYNIDSFYIGDDTFAINKNRAFDFCDNLLKQNLDVVWAMETRVNLVNAELLKAVKEAGCIQVEFGVESGSQEALDRMKKGIKVEDTIRAFDLCKKYGLRTFANIMLNTPGETEEDVYKTLRLKKRIKANHAGVNLTVPMVGTDIYETHVLPRLTKEEYHLFEDPHLYTRITDPRFRLASHNLDLDRLYYVANIFNYLNPFFEFTTNRRYLKSLISSKRKHQIIPCILNDILKQLRAYYNFVKVKLTKMIG